MANRKLSVLQRTHDKTGWHKSTQFKEDDIKNIKVSDSKSDKSLNAIPSPLARLHLFDAAFGLIYQDETRGTNDSGHAYQKLVSDCFDVFEIIYNWNSHIRQKIDLKFVVWKREEETQKLQSQFLNERRKKEEQLRRSNDENKALNLLEINGFKENLVANTLNLFLQTAPFNLYNEIVLIKVGEQTIAGTSPLTGFFTTPNDLSDLPLINPLTKRRYFSKITPLVERDDRVKKYIYDFFVTDGEKIFKDQLAIRRYLEHHKREIDESVSLNLSILDPPISLFNDSIVLRSTNAKVVTDYFEENLVRVNYRINSEGFYIPSNNREQRKHDYLLPFTNAFFEDFSVSQLSSIVNINEKDPTTIEVLIKKGNETLKKIYKSEKIHSIDGKLIDLWDSNEVMFSLAVYPNLIINNMPQYNTYYKVMVGFKKGRNVSDFVNNDINLSFFTQSKSEFNYTADLISANDKNINFSKFDRSDIEKTPLGSSYYQINGTAFDYARISIRLPNTQTLIEGSFAPKWTKRSIEIDKKFKFAIDFGTTTTFVAYTEILENANPKPLSIERDGDKNEVLVSQFNQPAKAKTVDSKQSPYDYETFEEFKDFLTLEFREFLPVIIGSAATSKFSFPIRTALCEFNGVNTANLNSLSNANIAFGHEKIIGIDRNNRVRPNLKWSIEKQTGERVYAFLEELLHLIKYKILVNEGNPAIVDIVWFSPLSFNESNIELFENTWKKLFNSILKSSGTLANMSESEAPFYFHFKTARAQTIDSVLSIDIGGGSTDIVCFEKTNPRLGSSFHFAANLLWSEGNNDFKTARENGIYKSFVDKIRNHLEQKSQGETDSRKRSEYDNVRLVNESYLDAIETIGADEIINFWLSNDAKTQFTDELKKSTFKINFLLFFSAIIYHVAQLMKVKQLPIPDCICISGNGSKVIDLITTDKAKLSTICEYFIKSVYNTVPTNYLPNLILPNQNERKEATSYGGLYKWNTITPLSFSYLGVKTSEFEDYQSVKQFKDITSNLDSSVKENLAEFITTFIKMNEIINFKDKLGIEMDLQALKNYLLKHIEGNYSHIKEKEKAVVKNDHKINDSIFFWPLRGILFDLSNLDHEILSSYVSYINRYSEGPLETGEFTPSSLVSQKSNTTLYKLQFESIDAVDGKLFLEVDDDYLTSLALSNIETYLSTACFYKKLPTPDTSLIRVTSPGTIVKSGEKWLVKEKIKIEFR